MITFSDFEILVARNIEEQLKYSTSDSEKV